MPRSYRGSAKTQHNILAHAIALFNEHGTDAISTNAIAVTASISPGNLYYHFHNKEEIIRAIHGLMIEDWDALYAAIDFETFGKDALRQLVRSAFDLVWKYRFFFREKVALLRKDDQLRQSYQTHQQQRLASQNEAFRHLAETRGASPIADQAGLTNALRIAWILNDAWILHLETTGQPVNEQTLQAGVDLILHNLSPFLPDKTGS